MSNRRTKKVTQTKKLSTQEELDKRAITLLVFETKEGEKSSASSATSFPTAEMPTSKRIRQVQDQPPAKKVKAWTSEQELSYEPWYKLYGIQFATWSPMTSMWHVDTSRYYKAVVQNELRAEHFVSQYMAYPCLDWHKTTTKEKTYSETCGHPSCQSRFKKYKTFMETLIENEQGAAKLQDDIRKKMLDDPRNHGIHAKLAEEKEEISSKQAITENAAKIHDSQAKDATDAKDVADEIIEYVEKLTSYVKTPRQKLLDKLLEEKKISKEHHKMYYGPTQMYFDVVLSELQDEARYRKERYDKALLATSKFAVPDFWNSRYQEYRARHGHIYVPQKLGAQGNVIQEQILPKPMRASAETVLCDFWTQSEQRLMLLDYYNNHVHPMYRINYVQIPEHISWKALNPQPHKDSLDHGPAW